MIDISVEKRLSVFSGGSFQGLSISVMEGLRSVLTSSVRKVFIYGLHRDYHKALFAQLRAEYAPYGATVTVNAGVLGGSLDIAWPQSDVVTCVVMKTDPVELSILEHLAHDTRVFNVTARPLSTTQLFDLYDVARRLGIHIRIYTTGYVPEPGPLSLLESFELIRYVSSAKVVKQVTADINAR